MTRPTPRHYWEQRGRDLLIQAADIVKASADKATSGPWQPYRHAESADTHQGWRVDANTDMFLTRVALMVPNNPISNARWISLLNPEIAGHFESLFRKFAQSMSDESLANPAAEHIFEIAKLIVKTHQAMSDSEGQ